jgi:GNAT superfamily N-acetyltransferase
MRITPYSDADRERILTLWSEALPLDTITQDVFESRVLLDENFDPSTLLLAKENEKLVGFVIGAYAKRMPLGDHDPKGTRSWITVLAVHPRSSLREVGGSLIAEIEKRFRSLGKTECVVSGYPPGYFTPGIDKSAYGPLLELFQSSGYAPYHEALSMDASIVLFEITDKVNTQQKKLSEEGIEVRAYRRSDLVKFLDFLERTMQTDWVRVERRNLRKMSEGSFRKEQITVVTKDDDIIGYCQFEGSHFGPFGVGEKFQGKGIGTVLLARAIERMKQAGHHNAWVMWTDDVAAKVYDKFGFKETRRFILLNKKL